MPIGTGDKTDKEEEEEKVEENRMENIDLILTAHMNTSHCLHFLSLDLIYRPGYANHTRARAHSIERERERGRRRIIFLFERKRRKMQIRTGLTQHANYIVHAISWHLRELTA